jgi:dimethylhistidine N-methyltransferase
MTSIVQPAPATAMTGSRDRFAFDVRDYLTRHQRQLPSRYLYDELGSALFEAISRLPWYPLTRAELRLLQAHAREILDAGVTTVVELGAGSGLKLSSLIRAAGPDRAPLAVHVVDVSASALAQTRRTLESLEEVSVSTHEATYEIGLEEFGLARPEGRRMLMLFLGSNIGNFDPPGRDVFLRFVRAALHEGDGMLLGVDLVKPERELLLAYDDPLGVTAAFNLNLLARINRELQGDFDLDGFAHHVLWNPAHSRIEMHLRSRRAQRIGIPGAHLDLVLREGETIWTESSYKYDAAGIVPMLERCGFSVRAQWIDAVDRFALTRAEAV